MSIKSIFISLFFVFFVARNSYASCAVYTGGVSKYSALVYSSSLLSEGSLEGSHFEFLFSSSSLSKDNTQVGILFKNIIWDELHNIKLKGINKPQRGIDKSDWDCLKSINLTTYAAIKSYFIFSKAIKVKPVVEERVEITIPELFNLKQELIDSGSHEAVAIVSVRLAQELEVISLLDALSEYEYALPYLGGFDKQRPMETYITDRMVNHWIADVYNDLQLHFAALEYANKIISTQEAREHAFNYNPSIYALNNLNRYDEALTLSNQAIENAKAKNNKNEIITSYMLKISTLTQRLADEDRKLIINLSNKIEELLGDEASNLMLMYSKLSKALSYTQQEKYKGDVDKVVEEYLMYANIILSKSKYPNDLQPFIFSNLKRIYELSGNFKKALYFEKKYQSSRVTDRSQYRPLQLLNIKGGLSRDIAYSRLSAELTEKKLNSLKTKNYLLKSYILGLISCLAFILALWLWKSNKSYKLMANNDFLTKVLTRRAMYKWIESRENKNESNCFVLLDLDNFKSINDKFGHIAGDEVLSKLGELLKKNIRKSDQVCRFGGEEFLVVLTGINLEGANRVLNQVRSELINYTSWKNIPMDYQVSFSAGLLETRNAENIESLIKRCDILMYRAKKKGRSLTECERL